MSHSAPRPDGSRHPPEPRPVLELPRLGDEDVAGGRWVRRAVGFTLGVVLLLGAAGAAVAAAVSMEVTVRAAGVLEPGRVWAVRSRETGVVDRVLVRAGDTVAAGTPVARLDTLELAGALAQLESDLRTRGLDLHGLRAAAPLEERELREEREAAAARLVQARATLLQRAVEYDLGGDVDAVLARHRPGAHVALDLAVAEVRAAESALRAAAARGGRRELRGIDALREEEALRQLGARRDATLERLRRLTLTAPAAGVVLTRELEQLPGALVREGETVLEVADLESWRVRLWVSEREVHRIRAGDPVKVEVRAFRAAERDLIRGRVESVAAEAAAAGGRRPEGADAYEVLVALDAADVAAAGPGRLRRGFTAEGTVILGRERILSLAWKRLRSRVEGR